MSDSLLESTSNDILRGVIADINISPFNNSIPNINFSNIGECNINSRKRFIFDIKHFFTFVS
jgi:hypothetical protein